MKVLIVSGRVHELLDLQVVPLPAPLPADMEVVEAPANAKPGWYYQNGTFSAPGPSGSSYNAGFFNAEIARQELVKTDRLVIYSYESGEKIPVDWKIYRNTLRDIVNKDGSSIDGPMEVPPRPPLPPEFEPIAKYIV